VHGLPNVLIDVLIHFEVVEVLLEFIWEPVFWMPLAILVLAIGIAGCLSCVPICIVL
jgi:hypothetical protein